MEFVSNPQDLEPAWDQQYHRLAEEFSRILGERVGILVEIGCGKGQLTILLAERLSHYQIIGVDQFTGPYSTSRTELLSELAGRERKIGIKVIVSDYKTWLASQADSKYDAVISSEFLPEIDSKNMRIFFDECYRVLRPDGMTIHSFLSDRPRNVRQRRMIEADSDPRWTNTPPIEWFSPPDRLVFDCLKKAGFQRLRKLRLSSGLVFRSEAARLLLADWDVRQSYWRAHREELENSGLEIPDWLIISGVKTRKEKFP